MARRTPGRVGKAILGGKFTPKSTPKPTSSRRRNIGATSRAMLGKAPKSTPKSAPSKRRNIGATSRAMLGKGSLGVGPGAPHGTPTPPTASPSGSSRRRPNRALKTLQKAKKATAAGKPRRALRYKQRAEKQLNRSVGKKPTKQFRNKQRAQKQLQRSVSGRGGTASDALRIAQGKKRRTR